MNGLLSGVISVVYIRAYITMPIEPAILTPMPSRRGSPIPSSPIMNIHSPTQSPPSHCRSLPEGPSKRSSGTRMWATCHRSNSCSPRWRNQDRRACRRRPRRTSSLSASLRSAQTSPVLPPDLLLSSAAAVTYSMSLDAYSRISTSPWSSGPGAIYFGCSVFHTV